MTKPSLSSRIAQILSQVPAQPEVVPAMPAPSAVAPGMEAAYMQAPPATLAPATQPFQLNQGLEEQVAAEGGNIAPEPLVQAIMKRMGILSMVRNRANENMIQ